MWPPGNSDQSVMVPPHTLLADSRRAQKRLLQRKPNLGSGKVSWRLMLELALHRWMDRRELAGWATREACWLAFAECQLYTSLVLSP